MCRDNISWYKSIEPNTQTKKYKFIIGTFWPGISSFMITRNQNGTKLLACFIWAQPTKQDQSNVGKAMPKNNPMIKSIFQIYVSV
jgi:hypothetical protein